jgi:hypothetical protein
MFSGRGHRNCLIRDGGRSVFFAPRNDARKSLVFLFFFMESM